MENPVYYDEVAAYADAAANARKDADYYAVFESIERILKPQPPEPKSPSLVEKHLEDAFGTRVLTTSTGFKVRYSTSSTPPQE